LKGRRIDVPATAAVRPTAERVREALFSILGAAVRGARVLDAYAGSGALGFEALSRGAESVVFAEDDPRVAAALHRNAVRLGVESRCAIRVTRATDFLDSRGGSRRFDLILADPPYAGGEAGEFLSLAARRLADRGTIVIERENRTPPAPAVPGVALRRSARYGRSRLDLYEASA
jgi:16S rRNA (guanine966-N2)-methyltransferase